MKTRDTYFDNLKWGLIALVVIGHLIEPLYDDPWMQPLYLFIYTFHIPLFVFVSGYFSKNIGTADYFNKVISKLVIPYLVFQFLYSLVDYEMYGREQLTIGFFTPYWLMWFFFSMILWKSLMPYMIRIKYAIPIAVIIAILAGYAQDAAYYASISRTIVFFPFFLVGYYMDRSWIRLFHQPVLRILSAIILIGFVALLVVYSPYIQKEWLYGSFAYASLGHPEWGASLYRIGIYVVQVVVSIAVMSLIPQRTIPGISHFGGNTLYVYLWHGFVVMAITAGGWYEWFDSSRSKMLLIPLGLLITFVLSCYSIRKWSRWLIEPDLSYIFKSRNDHNEQTRMKQS